MKFLDALCTFTNSTNRPRKLTIKSQQLIQDKQSFLFGGFQAPLLIRSTTI